MGAHTEGVHTTTPRLRVAPGDHLLRRIRREYDELPSLQLSETQAMRLWSLDRLTCACVLDTLVATGFLVVDDRGRYVRADDCD